MKIQNLTIKKSDKTIINNLNWEFEPGKIHIIMGPNGSGKTTLSYSIAGHPDCIVANGDIIYKNLSLIDMPIHERALNGIYLAPQYPSSIEGLSHAAFLKEAINARQDFSKLPPMDEFDILSLLKEKASFFKFNPKEYIKTSLNSGFSGGEKKRNEILQISILKPNLIILDEIDSGLDIEAMGFISEFINNYLDKEITVLAITHYPSFAKSLNSNDVHIMKDGRFIKRGDKSLIDHIESNGFGDIK